MEWIEIVTNPKAILNLYDSSPPLTKVDLLEIHHRPARAMMDIRVALYLFPDHPPKRWHQDANTVDLSFTLQPVRSFISNLKGPDQIRGVNLQMTKDSDICRVVIEEHSDTLLECEAERIYIKKIHSYQIKES